MREDLGKIARIFANAFAAEPWNEQWTENDARTRIDSLCAAEGFVGFVACVGEEVLGAALGNRQPDDEASYRIREIFVRADLQRRGIGGRLLDHLERYLWMHGARQISLITAPDSPSTAFYLSHDYSRIGTIEGWASSAVFAKKVPSPDVRRPAD